MKKMITLLFSFALIFVGSVGASDDDKNPYEYDENYNVFINYSQLNNHVGSVGASDPEELIRPQVSMTPPATIIPSCQMIRPTPIVDAVSVDSVGASDNSFRTLINRKNSSVSVDETYTNNLKTGRVDMSKDVEFPSGEGYYSTQEIVNDLGYRVRRPGENISAEKFKSIQEQADSLLQPGYCETVYFLGSVSKSTLVRPTKMNDEYSSRGQCLNVLAEYQAVLAARKVLRKEIQDQN